MNDNSTRDPALPVDSKRQALYFLNRILDDLVCYRDLEFDSYLEERDSSSAAIESCMLVELADSCVSRADNAPKAILRTWSG